MVSNRPTKRIGIYSGAFDPVHAGHVAFALQAAAAAELDEVYFLPERQPRNKPGAEHFAHRCGMLRRALLPHSKFAVLETVERNFTVAGTLPKLQKQFPGSELVLLLGSDVAIGLPNWPNADQLLAASELVIGLRGRQTIEAMQQQIDAWPTKPKVVTVINSYAPHLSSTTVRESLRSRQPTDGLLTSVARYSDKHWLYVALPG